MREEVREILIQFAQEVIATWFVAALAPKIDKATDKMMALMEKEHDG